MGRARSARCEVLHPSRSVARGRLRHADAGDMAVPKSLFFKENSPEPLSVLDFSQWGDSVDDTVLAHVAARNGTRLTALNLDHCPSWTQNGMRDLVRSCVNLRFLSLSRCPGADEDTLQWIGQYCRKLTHLGLAHCLNVSAEGIIKLTANAKALQMLDVEGCARLEATGVAAVASTCRRLRGLKCAGVTTVDISVAEVRWWRLAVCAACGAHRLLRAATGRCHQPPRA